VGSVLPPVLDMMVRVHVGQDGEQTVLSMAVMWMGTIFVMIVLPIGSDAMSVSHPKDSKVPKLRLLFSGVISTLPNLDVHRTLFCVHNLKQCLTLL
jgi:hypothetical protein